MATVTFDIDRFMAVLKKHNRGWDVPSVTLISGGGASPFMVLVSTVLSLRTKDAVTLAASRRLFKAARTPGQLLDAGCAILDRRHVAIYDIDSMVV